MKTFNFKTNINCTGCISAVTPYMTDEEHIVKWKVDTDHPAKILTVEVMDMSPADVIKVVEKAGYAAEEVDLQVSGLSS